MPKGAYHKKFLMVCRFGTPPWQVKMACQNGVPFWQVAVPSIDPRISRKHQRSKEAEIHRPTYIPKAPKEQRGRDAMIYCPQ
jgi:hypothetical protein